MKNGSVVQLDRISDFGSEGWGFESSLGHFIILLIFPISVFSQQILETHKLSRNINETSGLEYYGDFLVTHNDSGNPAELFYLNDLGEIIFKRKFKSLKNYDWEDLASDNDYLYIADIGNNYDTRKNLRIIKVPNNPKEDSNEIISFYYPEQEKFSFRKKSKYDAESLVCYDDYLLIFTKNRNEKLTEIYKVPKNKGEYIAEKVGTIETGSIVTAADYNRELNLLVLTATKNFKKYYLIKIENFALFSEIIDLKMVEIPVGKTQIESIKIINQSTFWLTTENEKKGNPFLYKLTF